MSGLSQNLSALQYILWLPLIYITRFNHTDPNTFEYHSSLLLVMSRTHRFFFAIAILMTIALFVVGGHPSASYVFQGNWHWIAHFSTYAIMAGLYRSGLPKHSTIMATLVVVSIGGLHEFYEIWSHGHPFELEDFLVNGAGAAFGALFMRTVMRLLASKPSLHLPAQPVMVKARVSQRF